MHKVFLYTWQLPQNILALFLLLIYRKRVIDEELYRKNITIIYLKGKEFGVSLGNYIFLSSATGYQDQIDIDHEYGHCVQSRRSGPFYLFIYGLPSIILNIICRIIIQLKGSKTPFVKNYYNRWPEKQADIFGGVFRS